MPRLAKFNAIRVAEISVSLLETPAQISAKAALVNTENGSTHGWTTCKSWSPETMAALRALRESMERDLEVTHFSDGPSTSSPTTSSGGMREQLEGLGEHLGDTQETTPQG